RGGGREPARGAGDSGGAGRPRGEPPVPPLLSRGARRRAPARRWLAAAAIAAVVLAAGCFPGGSTGGSLSTHHNDPFLTCVRQRESGGRYQIDSANGLYHGAYQFLQSTWDATPRPLARL